MADSTDARNGIYARLEEKYYSFLDSLEEKGIPVYKIVDPIEGANIPTFPLALVGLLVLLGLVIYGVNSALFGPVELSVSVQDSSANAVGGALVSVSVDSKDFDSKTTGANGKAAVKVPAGKEAGLAVSKKGYADKAVKYTAKAGGESTTVQLDEVKTTVKKTISLLATGTSRAFDKDLQVQFTCTGTDFTKTLPNDGGQIEVEVPGDCDTLKAKPLGNFTASKDTIFLPSDTTYEIFLSDAATPTGSALVTLKNAAGETVVGVDVSLVSVTADNRAGTAFETRQTGASGTAAFSAVPAGRYTITAYDRAGNYAEFDGTAQSLIQEVGSGATVQFAAVLAQGSAGKIKLALKDKATGQAVLGAAVKLSKGSTEVKTEQSGEDGSVQFSVGEDIEYNIMVDKAGYLLLNSKARPSADTKELLIEQATVENSQSLVVTILDENEKPIEGARVKLKNNADGSQAGPEIVTGLDGRATFERVQDGTYYVYAEKPGFGNKSSDPVAVNSRKQNTLTLLVPLGSGKIEVGVADEGGKAITNATIKAVDFSTTQALDEAGTDSDGKKVFSIRSDKQAFLIVSANGYANAVTAPIGLQRDVTVKKSVVLQKAVSSFGIEFKGLYSGEESVSESGGALTPGQKYTAKFTLQVPRTTGFDEAGAHIRTGAGQNGSIEKDYLYITEVRAAYRSLAMGTTFTPGTGQANDFSHLTSGSAKWANVTIGNVLQGTYEIEADIQVRDEAKIGTPLEVSYRAWGKSGSGFLRFPNDSELGTAESGSARQGLYANASKRTFSAGPSSLCSEDFCSRYEIEDQREKITSGVIENYTGQIGNKYRLGFEISSASKTPFTQSQLAFKDATGSIAVESYKIKTAAGQDVIGTGVGSQVLVQAGDMARDSVVSGEIIFTAKKEGNVPLAVSITSGSGTGGQSVAYQKTIYLKILPAALMRIDIIPKIIVPFVNNNILVHVTDGNGEKALANATVGIKKDGAVVAGGETGIDGVFAYTLSSPSDGSTIGIAVEKSGFRPAEKELRVTANILQAMPESLRLSMTASGADLKTLTAMLNNYSQIPLEVEKVQFGREFDGYVIIDADSPKQGDVLSPDSNAALSASVTAGPKAADITKPTKLQGTVTIQLKNNEFRQKWLASIPLEITMGFGEELDDTTCFTLNPSDWKIFGATDSPKKLEVGLSNSCSVGGEKVKVTNLAARIVSGSDNLFGKFRATSSIEGGKQVELDKAFRTVAPSVAAGADEKLTIEFVPEQVVSGKADGRIEVQASHLTARGEQKLVQKIMVTVSVNSLNECVEVLANNDITLNSCPGNIGYGNYGNSFSQLSGTRYGQYDPYSSRYGYGTGNPPFLTPGTQGSLGNRAPIGMNPYDYTGQGIYTQGSPYMTGYQNTFFPNPFHQQPFYGGAGSFMGGGFDTAWSCGPANVQVRNNCASPIELSFESQPGITVANRTAKVDVGKIEDVQIEPTNFFGRYGLDIKAKPSESNERAATIKRIFVNVTNEFAKDYRDCISIDPAGTISFNDFLGRPAVLTIRNQCYGQGVFVRDDPSALSFATSSALTPTNNQPVVPTGQQGPGGAQGAAGIPRQGQGYATGVPTALPGYQNNPNIYAPSNVAPGAFPSTTNYSQFGGMLQSVQSLGTDYQTSPDGRITQMLKFNLLKNIDEYRNNAPDPKFFTNNQFYNAGNLRYFVSKGYFTVNAPSILFVRFTTPSGLERSVSFPLTLQDLWSALPFVENLAKQYTSYGDPSVPPANCLNLGALRWDTEVPVDYTLRTLKNGGLFKTSAGSQAGVCGTVDTLNLIEQGDFKSNTGLIMHVRPDPADPQHELQITFEEQGWKGQATGFNNSIAAEVNKQSPPSTKLLSLPISARVKAGTPSGPGGTGGPLGTGGPGGSGLTVNTCQIGNTGTSVYNYYGFQNLQYKWGADPAKSATFISRDACDAYQSNGTTLRALNSGTVPLFCDALQTSISLSQKAAEISKVVVAVKKLVAGGTGTCKTSAAAGMFDCANPDNMNTSNLFRYAILQSPTGGYFIGTDGSLISLTSEFDLTKMVSEPTRDIVGDLKGKQINPATAKDTIIPKTGTLASNLTTSQDMDNLPTGTMIVLEMRNWNSTGLAKAKATDWTDPSQIGGETLGGNWYVMPLANYLGLHRALQECMDKDAKFTACQYSYGGKSLNISRAFLEQLTAGTWKLTARNTADMGADVQEAIMKRGKWSAVTDDVKKAYPDFFRFQKQNISPQVYLMADYYPEEFVSKLYDNDLYKGLFKDMGRPKFSVETTAGGESTDVLAGRYTAKLNYNWSKNELAVKFTEYNSLTKMGLAGYAANPLFGMPYDGKLNWGTKFTAANAGILNFDYAETQTEIGGEGKTESASPEPAVNFTYDTAYNSTKSGRIASFGQSEFYYAPSEPVILDFTIRKADAKKPAGILFDFFSGGAKTDLGIGFTAKNDTIANTTGTLMTSKYKGDELCTTNEAVLNREYEGLVFKTDAANASAEFTGVAYIPSRINALDTSLNIACMKSSGNVKAQYPMNSNAIRNYTGNGQITLSIDETQTNYKNKYNIKKLLEMAKDDQKKTCIALEGGKIGIYWHDQAFGAALAISDGSGTANPYAPPQNPPAASVRRPMQ